MHPNAQLSGTIRLRRVMEVRFDFVEYPFGCPLVLLKDLMPFFSHRFPGTLVVKEASHLVDKIFASLDLDCSAPVSQKTRDFEEVEHVGAKENALFKKEGLQGVVTSHGYKASADEDYCSKAVELHQLTHGIKEDDTRFPR